MAQAERIEALKRITQAIGFEYFKLDLMDRPIFLVALKKYMNEQI